VNQPCATLCLQCKLIIVESQCDWNIDSDSNYLDGNSISAIDKQLKVVRLLEAQHWISTESLGAERALTG
jgi:hypothetical protein